MLTSDDLMELAENKFFISVEFVNLRKDHPELLGKANAKKKEIEIDESLKFRPPLFKCVMAEEIGHIIFPPRAGHVAYHSIEYIHYNTFKRSNTKVIVAQDERMALDWATGVLIPDVSFWQAIKNGINTVYQLAEYFEVEEWFVNIKIGYIRRKARDNGQKLKWRDIIRRK